MTTGGERPAWTLCMVDGVLGSSEGTVLVFWQVLQQLRNWIMEAHCSMVPARVQTLISPQSLQTCRVLLVVADVHSVASCAPYVF